MNQPFNFLLFGVGGFIAPRHLKAIKDTGNRLVAALDKHDSVGIMDSYFPEAEFFLEFEDVDYFLEKQKEQSQELHYASICTPNHLHAPEMAWSLKNGLNVICEKPLVMHSRDLDFLARLEQKYNRQINNILQLRYHDSIMALRQRWQGEGNNHRPAIKLTYITSRGNWYRNSWKNDFAKSGGVITNIGIHFFDMLMWIFGAAQEVRVHLREEQKAAGTLHLDNADVSWFLSIDHTDLPPEVGAKGQRTWREINIGGQELEFSSGFTDLHTKTYEEILRGKGFGLEQARPSIELVERLGTAPITQAGERHPLLAKSKI